jgi:hypothetical protein
MIDTKRFLDRLSSDRGADFEFGADPTRAEIREVVRSLKAEGLCGRRIAEQRLGPYFIASDRYGERELDLLEEVVDEEYADLDMCVRTRSAECSRLRGGCKGSR